MSRNKFLFLLLPIAAGVACSSPTGATGGVAKVPKILVADAGGNDRIDGFDDIMGSSWITVSTTSPSGIALDASNRIYVTDGTNNSIVRMDSISGAGAVAYGTSGSGIGQFLHPTGVFVDGAGKIYVADEGNARIVRMDDMNGTNWTPFGVFGPDTGQFTVPATIFVDGSSKIYIADFSLGRIVRIDNMNGTNWTEYGTVGNGVGQFSSPRGLFIDGTGRIYVADDLNNRVVRIDDMSGANWADVYCNSNVGTDCLLGPAGVSVVGNKLYVTSYKSARVIEMDTSMTGSNWQSLGSHGTGLKQFGQPLGIVAH
jgi:streptogramin lyase